MSKLPPRPLFIYGTLLAKPLLAWVITGDPSNTDTVVPLFHPARVDGYARLSLHGCDYPAVIPSVSSTVTGCLLTLSTRTQRRKLDDFEGETYQVTPVSVTLLDEEGKEKDGLVEADMYVWNGDLDAISKEEWSLEKFVRERLDDWIELLRE